MQEDASYINEDDPQPDMHASNVLGEIEVPWEHPPLLSLLKHDLDQTKGAHDHQVSKIDTWLNNLHIRGKAKPANLPNRSSVQPRIIRRQAEWRYTALSEPFLNTDTLFDVKPVTHEDVDGAEQNKLMLNHQFNNQMNKNQLIDDMARTAVDEGTVIFKLGWDSKEEVTRREVPVFNFIPDETLVQQMTDLTALQMGNPRMYDEQVPDELKKAHQYSIEENYPYRAEPTGETEIIEEVKILVNQPTVDICDYRNTYIDPTCQGDMKKANFVVTSFVASIAELAEDGKYLNLDKIDVESETVQGEAFHQEDAEFANITFKDRARKQVVVYEYWGFVNTDNNATNELTPIVAAWVGNTYIRLEENPFPDKELPFVNASYLPVRRSIYGEPDGALLEENQKIIGAVTRGMVDLLGRSANSQQGIAKGWLDTVNKKKWQKGLDFEFNPSANPDQATHMGKFPEIPQSAHEMIALMNHDAESLSGVKAYAGGLSGTSLGDTATGIRGVLDSASQRELGILRRLAYAMTTVGKKIISMNGAFLSEKEVVRVTNSKFVTIKREDLAGFFDIKLTISTAEQESTQAQELSFMLQTMGNTVDFGIIKKLTSKFLELRKMPELAEEMKNYEPQPDPMAVKKAELEIELLQEQIFETQSKTQENLAEAVLDKAKAAELGAKTSQSALDFIEQESGVTQERDLEKISQQAKGNILLEKIKQQAKPKTPST